MAPPCKWELSSLFSSAQPCTGALLETFCQKPGFVSCSFSKKGTEQRCDFFYQLQPLYRSFKFLSCLWLSPWLFTFQTLTSSDQDVKIHGCSFGNYLWVVLACLVGIFPVFLLTLCLESPLLWRGFFAGADCCQSCLQSYRSLEALAVLSRLKNRH